MDPRLDRIVVVSSDTALLEHARRCGAETLEEGPPRGLNAAVAMAAAVGMPDAYAGELPVCYVTLRPGAGGGAMGSLGLRIKSGQVTETQVDDVEFAQLDRALVLDQMDVLAVEAEHGSPLERFDPEKIRGL